VSARAGTGRGGRCAGDVGARGSAARQCAHAPAQRRPALALDVSDGTLAPEALAARAKAQGVELWALTDHDELGGQVRARDAALALGLGYLTGVELSVSFIGQTVHVLGLGVDLDDPVLNAGVRAVRDGRRERARRMGDALAAIGMPGAFEGALRLAGNADLVSRTHFGRFLVEAGHFASVHEVFRHVLADGKPGHVPHAWASLRDAVTWITGAGGVAVIAHPARYRFTPTEEYALFTEFIGFGGRGVEVLSGATPGRSGWSTPTWRASSACWRRAAATSTRRARAAPSSAPCPTCRDA
jgi:3',5'-nucleoside bisphosphate phosphatase